MDTQLLDITPNEVSEIVTLFESCKGASYIGMVNIIKRHFNNIKPGHYIVLGYLIGERACTDLHAQINNLQLCQRQN